MVATCHISSAVVRTLPERMQAVSNAIDALPHTQVFHAEDSRIIVVMEGPDSSALGSQLSEIALIEGVHEWARLKANDSLECRNCHTAEAMDLTRQTVRAADIHTRYLLSGNATCIDCHKGIAHDLPDMTDIDPGWLPPDEVRGDARTPFLRTILQQELTNYLGSGCQQPDC